MSTPKAEVVVAYEPPEREFSDTILAFRDFQLASTWSVRLAPDPLGPVNRIVTLMRGGRHVKSVLYPVNVGTTVRLVRDEGTARIRLWSATWEDLGEPFGPARAPGWRVDVDDRTVLTVTDAELHTPYVAPPVPRWRRFRHWTARTARSAADGLAGRLGYHREGECGGDW